MQTEKYIQVAYDVIEHGPIRYLSTFDIYISTYWHWPGCDPAAMEDEGGVAPAPAPATPASVRRELWRETQQQSVGSIEEFCHDTAPRWVDI